MKQFDEAPLSPDDAREVLAVARDAGADMGRPHARRLQEMADHLMTVARVRAVAADSGATVFEGLAQGYWLCPVVQIDVGEVRGRPWPLHLVEEARVPAPAAAAPGARPGVEQLPTLADMATARAMYRLRPGAPPWMGLAASARQNLSIAAMPLRRALIASGWTPPEES